MTKKLSYDKYSLQVIKTLKMKIIEKIYEQPNQRRASILFRKYERSQFLFYINIFLVNFIGWVLRSHAYFRECHPSANGPLKCPGDGEGRGCE